MQNDWKNRYFAAFSRLEPGIRPITLQDSSRRPI
jgi:hypothetical protein